MAKWCIPISGAPEVIDAIEEAIRHSAEWSSDRDKTNLVLFNGVLSEKDGGEALRSVRELCYRADRVTWLKFNRQKEKTSIGQPTYVEGDQILLWFVEVSAGIPLGFSASETISNFSLAELLMGSEDRSAFEALEAYLQWSNDWTQLNKIIERAEHSHGGSIPGSWVPKSKLKLLRHTAQFPTTAGNTARHIGMQGAPPTAPMSLSEAREIVRTIICEWLHELGSK